eukprot:Gb_19013 [translate_table: standard]
MVFEGEGISAESPTIVKEPIHYWMKSFEESPSLIGLGCTTLCEDRVRGAETLLTLETVEKNLVLPVSRILKSGTVLMAARLDRQRREEEQKNRSSKKAQDAEHALLNKATTPQTSSQQMSGSLKSMKEKASQADKNSKEESSLQSAGPGGELTAGFLLKRSAQTDSWKRRWFVLNEKTGKLGYTKKPEERHFRGVIALEVVIPHPWFKAISLNRKAVEHVMLKPGRGIHSYRAEMGYAITPNYWKMGLTTQAVMHALQLGFKDLLVQGVEALVLPDNTASQRVLEKAVFFPRMEC